MMCGLGMLSQDGGGGCRSARSRGDFWRVHFSLGWGKRSGVSQVAWDKPTEE